MGAADRSLERVANRWLFAGIVETAAPLHIGSGAALGLAAERAVVRDAAGQPYLPASTIKGALRSSVDRLGPVVGAARGITSCGLSPREERCPSPPGSPAFAAIEAALREFSGPAREREEQLLRLLEERLCSSCRLFGSPWLASRLFIADGLPLTDGVLPVEIRDGVSVDRDSGTARDLSHHSYEVVPASQRFSFYLQAENLDAADSALLALAFGEWQRGALALGGGHGRGMGTSRLLLEQVQSLDFAAPTSEQLRDYLRTGALPSRAPAEWLDQSVNWLLDSGKEASGA